MNKTVDHWIAVADTLKQQRDQAEKERDALRKDADIVRRARARSSVVVEVTPELLTKDAFTAQPFHVLLTDNGDGTHLLTFRESDELHTLRAERDALRKDAARVCQWREDDPDFGTWRTGCGHLWSFNAGGPEENDAKFCQYCGGALAVALPAMVVQPTTGGEDE